MKKPIDKDYLKQQFAEFDDSVLIPRFEKKIDIEQNPEDKGKSFVVNEDGKVELKLVESVREVSELPEEKENVIYKIVDDQRKVYTDVGTLEVVQVPGSYIGDLYVPIMSPFICDVNGTEYEVMPSEEIKFIFGSETDLPAIAYVIDTNKNQLQFRGVSNKEETFVLRKVDTVPQSTDVYAKDVRLLTENDSNLIQAVKEVDTLPEEKENVVYKVGASGASANEVLTPCDARQVLPTAPANTGLATFIIGKEYMFNFDHISMSYGGFTNRPYDWEDDGGEYAYYNIKKNGDNYEITGLPAFIIYRESTAYDVYAFADMTKGHYFETDAPSERFTPIYQFPAQATVKVPVNYTHYRPGYYSSDLHSLSESFDLEDLKYDATTRTMTCKNEGSGTLAYFTVAEDGINKLSSDSFTQRSQLDGLPLSALGAVINDEADSIIAFGEEYSTLQEFYKNIIPDTGVPTGYPSYGYSPTEGRQLVAFQPISDGIFVKPSDNKLWIGLDYSRDDPPRYIPTCITRIRDDGGTIHSTNESFEYAHSSYGISYNAETRILTMTGSSSDINVYFEVPAPVGNLAISSLTKVYAKDIELATKTSLESFESKVDGKLTEFVTLDTEQSVKGKKTFKDVDVNGNFNVRKIEGDVGSSVAVSKTQASIASEDDSGSNSKYSSVSVNGSNLQLRSSTADEQNSRITVDGPYIEENTHNDYGNGQHKILTDSFDIKADAAKVNDKNIVRSVQGNEADADGAVEIVALTELLGKVPAQASLTNQLADKNFVNSSIATNTAFFKGVFDDVSQLPTEGVTNNDYAYVTSTDAAGNTIYARYKFNGESKEWKFEYNLNNTGFTAEQFAAINSGITAENYGGTSAKATADGNGNNIANTYSKLDHNHNGSYVSSLNLDSITTMNALKEYTNTSPAFFSSSAISDGPAGNCWYNIQWIPHRNGMGSGDNSNYGQLILFPMTLNSATFYRYQKNSNAWTGPFSYSYASGSASNADLNTYKTPGNWRITSGSNLPPNMGGSYGQLLVLAGDTSDWVTQIFSVEGDDNNDVWYRKWNGDGWDGWTLIATPSSTVYAAKHIPTSQPDSSNGAIWVS